ncbi:MAG: FtsX-like permease family protein [Butyribacter sp.]|nr:FtsX-like permease family protein [bacterium]MDY3853583.1 FtsX-like permease family protein [Butyribacter sp.]
MNIINRFTMQTLKQNKIRTLVTIIGIILSTAMFTGVTSLVYSFQQYLVDLETETAGVWEGRMNGITKEQAEILCADKEIAGSTIMQNVGYAKLKESLNKDKPYLCVESIQKDFVKFSPVTLVTGRMPKNSNELVISEHIADNGGVSYQVGDVLNLEVGKRMAGEAALGGQSVEYSGDTEELSDTTQITYKVVGICERTYMEGFSAPGYTVFTTGMPQEENVSYDVFFQMKDPLKINSFLKKYTDKWSKTGQEELTTDVHNDLLRFQGKSSEASYVSVLRGMGSILILIIMIASVSLIYNAFSISVGERTKQFGLLKSIGATKKQIRKSVLFEAGTLCVIGIPVDVLGGLLGIGITLHFVGKLLADMLTERSSLQLELSVSWTAIAIAVVVAVITVFVSALIPARRAVKMPAMQALRQSNEIKIRKKNVRSSKLIYRLFGFEGMLANKNFKRNRRKHRMTVISLAVSVVLFLSASCFSNYMTKSIALFEDDEVSDITFNATAEELNGNTPDATKKVLAKKKGIDTIGYSTRLNGVLLLDKNQVSESYFKKLKENMPECYDKATGNVMIDTCVTFVEDDIYKNYLEKEHLDTARFLNTDKLCPLVWDTVIMPGETANFETGKILTDDHFDGELYFINDKKLGEYAENGMVTDAATMQVDSFIDDEGDTTETKTFSREEGLSELKLAGSQTYKGELPLGVSDMRYTTLLNLVLPYSATEKLPEGVRSDKLTDFAVKASDHNTAADELTEFFQHSSQYKATITSSIFDIRASMDATHTAILITNIFSYGFITLITLIVVANVFNTISTNVQLRRKEFAMLKSVGMTKKGFNRMMNYECLLYGVKGLLLGLPVSLVVCFLMYKSLQDAWNVSFLVPWMSVLIVIVSVFVIVFASMLYSMQKIKKENPIEALRDDNL